jgi:hypothetical protein
MGIDPETVLVIGLVVVDHLAGRHFPWKNRKIRLYPHNSLPFPDSAVSTAYSREFTISGKTTLTT